MKSFSYIIFISIVFSCLGQVASDLYLPSLPAISLHFHSSASASQLTVAFYMLGYALSYLFYGPVSDAIGRKKPLILGVTIFLLGTAGCIFSASIYTLIASRLLQGFGAGAGAVLGNTVIRDLSEGKNLAKAYSYLSVANMIAIASAPFFGGYLQQFFGWRASFFFLLIYGLLSWGISVFFLQETNRHRTLENLAIHQVKTNLYSLFSNRQFLSCVTCIFMVYGAILAWLTLAPIFLQNTLGVSPKNFGLIALIGGGFHAAGAFLNGKIVHKFGMKAMLFYASSLGFLSGASMLWLYLLFPDCLFTVVASFFIFIFCSGIIFPNVASKAMMPFAKIAGFACAIVGFLQISGGTISSCIMSVLPKTTPIPIALAIVLSSLYVFIVSLKMENS